MRAQHCARHIRAEVAAAYACIPLHCVATTALVSAGHGGAGAGAADAAARAAAALFSSCEPNIAALTNAALAWSFSAVAAKHVAASAAMVAHTPLVSVANVGTVVFLIRSVHGHSRWPEYTASGP